MRVRPGVLSLFLVAASLAARPRVHNHLVKADPAENGTIAAAPKAIELWFAVEPDLKLSGIALRPAADTMRRIATGRVERGRDAKSMRTAVTGHLAPGVYLVSWRTAGDDGHIDRGQYRFTLK
jgi:methionine-rich copper-binding protein CopC